MKCKCLIISVSQVSFKDEKDGKQVDGFNVCYGIESQNERKLGLEMLTCFFPSNSIDYTFLNSIFIGKSCSEFPLRCEFDWLTYVKDFKPVNKPANIKLVTYERPKATA